MSASHSISEIKQDNFHLALSVLDEIKKNVTCLNDLFPYPVISKYINGELFSSEKVLIDFVIQEQQERIRVLRWAAEQTLISYKSRLSLGVEDGRYNQIRMRLAIASFGYGECGENAEVAIFKLLQAGLQAPIYLIVADLAREHLYSNHGFAIVGNAEKLKNAKFDSAEELITAIQSLPEDCLLVDPYLNLVSSVKNLPQLFKDIFIKEKIHQITYVEQMNYIAKDLVELAAGARLLIEGMAQRISVKKFPEMRFYRGLLSDYKTVSCCPASPEDVIHLHQQLNFENSKPRSPQLMITNVAKMQISFLRSWLQKAGTEQLKEISTKLNAPALNQ